MKEIHQEFPVYAWDKNMGYPTKAHRAAIKEFGVAPYHRLSFKLLPSQLKLF
jgi:ribonuclease HII